jgi:hypothetical protein
VAKAWEYSALNLGRSVMAKIKNPITFSKKFALAASTMQKELVFNPVLNIDTALFIDPSLIAHSAAVEIKRSIKPYRQHFERILGFLKASNNTGDANWRLARRMFEFDEISGTCLGYGAGSVRGKKINSKILDEIIDTAQAIARQGIDDPDIFLIAFMLQEGIGADSISDMTTNVIIKNLAQYTQRIAKKYSIDTCNYTLGTPPEQFDLPVNPLSKNQFLLLVPQDILRELPVARDRTEVEQAISKTDAIRRSANLQIGKFFRAKTVADRKRQKDAIIANSANLRVLLDSLKKSGFKGYNFSSDPAGLLAWREASLEFALRSPKKITITEKSESSVKHVVQEILEQFQQLIEKNGMWALLYVDRKTRNEKFIQKLFFMVADSYCKANDIDISPETDSGGGSVDFKFSSGYKGRVLVEIKLASNPNIVAGYSKQLQTYKEAAKPIAAHYVIIENSRSVSSAQKKSLENLATDQRDVVKDSSLVKIIDGSIQKSASKRR